MGTASSKVARRPGRKLPATATSSSTITARSPISPTQIPTPSPSSSEISSKKGSPPGPGPTVQPSPRNPSAQPSFTRNEFIDLDARDPAFSSRLRSIGPAQPQPTQPSKFHPGLDSVPPDQRQQHIFPSPSTNPALKVIQAREKAAKRAEEEAEMMGRKGFKGRTILDSATLGMIVRAREKHAKSNSKSNGDEEVEGRWRLKKGILEERLGKPGGVFGPTS